jgi:glycosyltransferase involved in cell wall biosynthesis
MNEKIVFISHEATLTGAPILLLNIIRQLRKLLSYQFVIVLGKDGPLRHQMEEYGQVVVYPSLLASGHVAGALQRLGLLTRYNEYYYSKGLLFDNVKFIFSNTIVNGELVEKVVSINKAPVITYVHELAYIMQAYGYETIEKALKQTTQFLAGSDAVKENLVKRGVAEGKIEVVPSSIPVESIEEKLASIDTKLVRDTLNLKSSDSLVSAVGGADWRKGTDLFIQMAALVSRTQPHVHFVWVGIAPDSIEHLRMTYEIERYNLENRVHLIPVTPDYLKYIAASDIFVLSSREDPFPLVVLEAALAAKPIVCFAKTGGSPDFIGSKHGEVVPYGDVLAMSNSIVNLLSNESSRYQLGSSARDTTRRKHDSLQAAERIATFLK